MAGGIIVACIVAYCAFVIYRKVRDMKAGKYCSCDCSQCASHHSTCCSQTKDNEINKA